LSIAERVQVYHGPEDVERANDGDAGSLSKHAQAYSSRGQRVGLRKSAKRRRRLRVLSSTREVRELRGLAAMLGPRETTRDAPWPTPD
jgi:hypothetical protein